MSSRGKQPPPPPLEEEDEEFDEMEEEEDIFGSFLVTEDGITVADSLSAIAKGIESQNKIMIKILSVLSKLTPSSTA